MGWHVCCAEEESLFNFTDRNQFPIASDLCFEGLGVNSDLSSQQEGGFSYQIQLWLGQSGLSV